LLSDAEGECAPKPHIQGKKEKDPRREWTRKVGKRGEVRLQQDGCRQVIRKKPLGEERTKRRKRLTFRERKKKHKGRDKKSPEGKGKGKSSQQICENQKTNGRRTRGPNLKIGDNKE